MDAVGRAQVGAHYCEVDGLQLLDGLQLDHDLVGDEQVEAVPSHLDVAVEHVHGELSHEWDAATS